MPVKTVVLISEEKLGDLVGFLLQEQKDIAEEEHREFQFPTPEEMIKLIDEVFKGKYWKVLD